MINIVSLLSNLSDLKENTRREVVVLSHASCEEGGSLSLSPLTVDKMTVNTFLRRELNPYRGMAISHLGYFYGDHK